MKYFIVKNDIIKADDLGNPKMIYGYLYYHHNKINNKKYVGITTRKPEIRWGKTGSGYMNNMQTVFENAIKKYGWDNFEHIIVSEHYTKEELDNAEKLLIEKLKSNDINFGYNIRSGGNSLDENDRKVISERAKTFRHTEESKRKIAESNRRRKVSEETKEKIRQSLIGFKHSEETKKKLSERLSGTGCYWYGKHLSEEHKRKLSLAKRKVMA